MLHPLLPLKSYIGIIKNYRGITLTSLMAKVYDVQLLNRIESEIKKII